MNDRMIKHYKIISRLGQGGYGEDTKRNNRKVAIKTPKKNMFDGGIPDQLSASEQEEADKASRLFVEEALAIARLSMCDNVVTVIETDIKYPYVTMEYCSGGTLKDRLRKDYSLDDVVRWGHQIANALSAAHNLKPEPLVHRDLKPENILIDDSGVLKLSDFGTARVIRDTVNLMTLTNQQGYTVQYAAPEVLENRIHYANDNWSFGVIMYQMIGQSMPFDGDTPFNIMYQISQANPTPLSEINKLNVPEAIISLVHDCLQKDHTKRISASRCVDILSGSNAVAEVIIPGFTFLRSATHSCGGVTSVVEKYRNDKTDMEFALIPGGSFMMGGEFDTHKVTLSPFLISKYQVTQAIWKKVMGNNPSHFKGENNPVEQVSWNDCQEFCEKVGLQLPTEAQWEYACRAGTTTEYYWGDEIDGDYLWYGKNSDNKTHPVGEKKPNAFGLYDMSGNVWEWCQDGYSDYSFDSVTDPLIKACSPLLGSSRVVRGGDFRFHYPWAVRSAARHGFEPTDRRGNVGFRIARGHNEASQ